MSSLNEIFTDQLENKVVARGGEVFTPPPPNLGTEYFWAHICKRLRSPEIDSEKSIPPAYVAWQAGTTNRIVVPALQTWNRFLGSLKGSQLRAPDRSLKTTWTVLPPPRIYLLYGTVSENVDCIPVKDLVDGEAGEDDHPEPEQHEYLTQQDQFFWSL